MLELPKHEAGHHERTADEAGLANVGDAAVDDSAGVDQQLMAIRRLVR